MTLYQAQYKGLIPGTITMLFMILYINFLDTISYLGLKYLFVKFI
jgi:hypothetical protein